MTEDVGEPDQVFVNAVKEPREQGTQIVGEHFRRLDLCGFAELFHISPNVGTVKRLARFGDEDAAGSYAAPLCVSEQEGFQHSWEEYRPRLAFIADDRHAGKGCFQGDKPQFRHPDPRRAYGLQNEVEPFIAFIFRRLKQPLIFRFREFFIISAESLLLNLERLQLYGKPQKEKEAVERGENGVDARRLAPQVVLKMPLVVDCNLFGDKQAIVLPFTDR
jgi:hypothetical protein